MRRILLASLGVLLLMVGLVAYDRARIAAPEARADTLAAPAAIGTTPKAIAGQSTASTGANAATSPAATAEQADVGSGRTDSSIPASAGARLAPGPRLLSADSAQVLREFAESTARRDTRVADWLAEADAQHRDAEWAEAVEAQLRNSLRLQGTKLHSLEVGDPRCWTTVCIIYARGGTSTDDAASDWQGLVYRVGNEPWFPQTFADVNTMVGADARGMKYVSFLIRKK